MCVNVRPHGEGPLSSLVEEMEERLGEEGVQEVLRVVDGTEVEGKGEKGERQGETRSKEQDEEEERIRRGKAESRPWVLARESDDEW